jgi:glycerol-3-phosphate acyltransferase PlsY
VDALFLTLIGFFLGSIPFSLLIGRWAAAIDIRQVGDHNPGATNVLHAAGVVWFIPALLLDYLKGAIPVGLAYFFAGVDGWQIIPVALAPILGHAFSPWLGFRGGKAVATTFGVWTGLTVGTGPIILGILLVLMFAVVTISGWAVLYAFMIFGVFIYRSYFPVYPSFMVVWGLNAVLLLWLQRADLAHKPTLRPAIFFWRQESRS